MSKGFKRLLLSCAVIAVVLTTGSWILHSLWFQSYLLSELGRALHWNLTIRGSQLNLLRGRIYLNDVHAENQSKTMSVSADKVRFDISAFSIIRGKIIVTDFDVAHPVVFIQKTEKQKNVLPSDILQRIYGRYERSLLLQSILIEDATIEDLLLTVTDPASGEIKTGNIGKIVFGISTTLLSQFRTEATITETSGIFTTTKEIDFKASLGRRGLSVDRFHLEAPKVKLDFEGKFLGDLIRGSVQATGAVDVPTVLSEKVTFALDAALKEKTADVKSIKASLGKAKLDASGKIVFLDLADLKKIKYDLLFDAKDLPLESIFGKMPSPILGPAKGIGAVKGRFEGELPDLKAKANATIRDFHHGAMHTSQVEGTLNFHWPELDWDADIKPGGGRVEGHVKGGVAFRYLPPFKYLKATLKSVDLTLDGGTLKDILPNANVTGQLKGELHLRGSGNSTSAEGPGHAEVTQGHWFLGPIDHFATDMQFKPGGLIIFTKTDFRAPAIDPILWPDPITLDTKDGIVRYSGRPMTGLFVEGTYETKADVFKITTLKYQSGGSNLTGSLTMRDGGGTEAKLKGTANLENLSAIPALFRSMRGLADLDLSLTGTSKSPNIRGWIQFRKNEIELRGFPAIEDLEGRLVLEGPVVKPDLNGFLGDGRFHLGGNMTLGDFKPERFDLTLKGTDLTYSKPNAYRIELDADVRLSGAMPSPKLSGRIDIVDARYVKPFGIRDLVLKPFTEEPSEPDSWKESLDPLELDLSIKHSGDLRIKNNIADIYLLADLHVDGTYGRPLIRGAFTATEGELRLFGDTFTITEGRLEYIDPAKKEPYLTLTAEEDLPPLYTVFVQLKGYLSNLEVILSSTPALPREDVLALITTGHTQEELRQSGLTRQSMGIGVLAGEITSALEQPIARSTGLDVFRLEASESGQLSKVALGKNLTDRLTLEFQSDFAPETAQRTLQANYYLTDNILLKGTRVWQSGQSGTTPRYNLNMSFRVRLY